MANYLGVPVTVTESFSGAMTFGNGVADSLLLKVLEELSGTDI